LLTLWGALVSRPSDAAAQDVAPFIVRGRVVNGTSGATLPDELQLQLVAFRQGTIVRSWDVQAQPDGAFTTEPIERVEGASYVVGSTYQDVVYVDWVEVAPDAREVNASLTIYESIGTEPGLRFEQSAVVVSEVDASGHTLSILEVHSLVNPSDRTFTPRADGPGGRSGLLVFGLPPNAFDLRPESGLDPNQLVQINLGFASLNPVLPGRSEIAFRYRVPYAESPFAIDRTVRYPVNQFRVLSALDGPPVASSQLAEAPPADIGGRQYRALAGGPFDNGDAIQLRVQDLPLPPVILGGLPPLAAAGAGVAAGLVVLAMAWRKRTKTAVAVSPATNDEEVLIEQLVELDMRRDSGQIADAEYQEQREQLIGAVARARAGTETSLVD
jgi:hypothetical protein